MGNLFVYKPDHPSSIGVSDNLWSVGVFNVFLAGTIDNGDSTNWQREVINLLKQEVSKTSADIGVYNPRRDTWDPAADHDEVMKQIDWEQRTLEKANHIVMVFLDNSKSPISLLELGMYCKSKKITVFCTEKFYRYDNVLDTCKRYGIVLVHSTDPDTIAKRILSKASEHVENF